MEHCWSLPAATGRHAFGDADSGAVVAILKGHQGPVFRRRELQIAKRWRFVDHRERGRLGEDLPSRALRAARRAPPASPTERPTRPAHPRRAERATQTSAGPRRMVMPFCRPSDGSGKERRSMRWTLLTMVVTSVIGATGCGGGGGGSQSGMSGGGLTAQVLWQQPGQAGPRRPAPRRKQARVRMARRRRRPVGFRNRPPLAVRTIRIQIDPSEGASCCVSAAGRPFPTAARRAPCRHPEPSAGRSLTTLAGFATDFASNDGVKRPARSTGPVVDGEPLASPCDPRRATPSFSAARRTPPSCRAETTDAGPLFRLCGPVRAAGRRHREPQPEPTARCRRTRRSASRW
mgnify:CR=1 FL=1